MLCPEPTKRRKSFRHGGDGRRLDACRRCLGSFSTVREHGSAVACLRGACDVDERRSLGEERGWRLAFRIPHSLAWGGECLQATWFHALAWVGSVERLHDRSRGRGRYGAAWAARGSQGAATFRLEDTASRSQGLESTGRQERSLRAGSRAARCRGRASDRVSAPSATRASAAARWAAMMWSGGLMGHNSKGLGVFLITPPR